MKVSIVIPNFKKQPLIKHLPQILKACPNCEIIVADDASPDDTVLYLKKHFPQVKVVVNATNQRFATTCNHGIKAASGDIVVLINSDVTPKSNFLKPLLKHFKDKRVFAVGCKEIQTTAGKKHYSGRSICQFKRGFLIHQKAKNQNLRSTCWAAGGSMAVDRQKYLSLGGMDQIYKPAYWEDIDLSWRAKKRGWLVYFEPKSLVHHHHETTNVSVFGQRKIEQMSFRNQLLFVWKNIRGRKLIEHFLWLPYHLTITTMRTRGIFLLGFIQALWRQLTFKRQEVVSKP